jgi:hypothetical protein
MTKRDMKYLNYLGLENQNLQRVRNLYLRINFQFYGISSMTRIH